MLRADPHHQPQLSIAFVLAPRFTLTAFAGLIDAFRLASDEADHSRAIACNWEVLSGDDELIPSSCGVLMKPWGELRDPARFDYVVVVGELMHSGRKASSAINRFLLAARICRVHSRSISR